MRNETTTLLPPEKPLDVPVEVDRSVTEQETIAAFKRAGLVDVSDQAMHDIESVGIYVKGAGVLKNQRGRAVITQQRVEMVMRELYDRLRNPRPDGKGHTRKISNTEAIKIANAIGYLAGKLTDSQRMLLETELAGTGGGAVTDKDVPVNTPFPAGQAVGKSGATQVFAKEAHFHTSPAEAPEKK